MPLFTVIATKEKGTYFEQYDVENAQAAFDRWAKEYDLRVITGFSEEDRKKIIDSSTDEPVKIVDQLQSVWTKSMLINDKFLLIDIIKTVPTKP